MEIKRQNWPPEVEDGYHWVWLYDSNTITMILVEGDKIWFMGDEDYNTWEGLESIVYLVGPKIEQPKSP